MNIHKEDILKLFGAKEFDFKPTQAAVCVPIVNRIYKKMKIGIKFDGIKVYEGLIIDGHHRYIASLLANFDLQKYNWAKPTHYKAMEWKEIEITEKDWDTEDKIDMLNREDAKYNGLLFEQLAEMIKKA
ncbi:MAG: hypothetical protein KF900_04995 [Bacteroidetes bacterium]|nr:hypothetical protein [Bacteroidota bacterium]